MAGTKGGKGRKIGRNKDKCNRYKVGRRRERNKIARVLRSSGIEEAKRYSVKYGVALPKQAQGK